VFCIFLVLLYLLYLLFILVLYYLFSTLAYNLQSRKYFIDTFETHDFGYCENFRWSNQRM